MAETFRKPLLILDLDQTLVYASDHAFSRPPDLTFGPYFVYDRPYLREFLKFVTSHFRPAIWSAANASYVEALTNHLFPDLTQLHFIWTREQCSNRYDLGKLSHAPIKDLRRLVSLGEPLSQVLHLSVSPPPLSRPTPHSTANLLPLPPFEGDPRDTLLLDLIKYLTPLSSSPVPDFRTLPLKHWQTTPIPPLSI